MSGAYVSRCIRVTYQRNASRGQRPACACRCCTVRAREEGRNPLRPDSGESGREVLATSARSLLGTLHSFCIRCGPSSGCTWDQRSKTVGSRLEETKPAKRSRDAHEECCSATISVAFRKTLRRSPGFVWPVSFPPVLSQQSSTVGPNANLVRTRKRMQKSGGSPKGSRVGLIRSSCRPDSPESGLKGIPTFLAGTHRAAAAGASRTLPPRRVSLIGNSDPA